jgi:hypothetical protein
VIAALNAPGGRLLSRARGYRLLFLAADAAVPGQV